jgi:L-fuculose-phosphate aldolase
MTESVDTLREKIARYGKLLFERHLTDMAGGNISARAGNYLCMSPRYAGSSHHWNLRPQHVLVYDLQGNKLDGEGDISREAKAHFRLMNAIPEIGAVVHGHPCHVMVFAALAQPMLPVLEATVKFGEIKITQYAPSHTQDLAEYILEGIAGQEERIRKQAAAIIAPWHGLFVAGKDLEAAVDAAERIDVNAHAILTMRATTPPGVPDPMLTAYQRLTDALQPFTASNE